MQHEESSLKEKTARGLFWGGFSNALQQLLNLFFGIFLARILTQEDYGMVGMLTIFSLLANTLQESGFIVALANKKQVEHRDYNAVFWCSLGISITLYALLFAAAPLIADFFDTPALTPLARYAFIGFLISSLGIAPSAWLFRNLKVKQRSMAAVIALILSGTTGILMTCNGFAYWGIATQNVVFVLVTTCCYWGFSSWRPTWHMDFSPLKSIYRFSVKILLTNAFTHLNNNLFSVILGRYYNAAAVGEYNQANKWNYMGHSLINGMVGSVAQPVLSQVNDERERQLHIFRKMLRFTAFVSFPAMLGLSLIAPQLITIAITERWIGSAHILQLLCIGGAFLPIATLYTNLILSKGRSEVYMWGTIAQGVLQLLVMWLLRHQGIRPMVITYVGINIAWIALWHHFVHKAIGLRALEALKDLLPFALTAALSMGASYLLTRQLTNIYLLLLARIVTAALLYALLMWLARAEVFRESMRFLLKRSKRPCITLVPEGGLANRMKAIDAAVALARDTESRLRIIWFKDWGLNCRFDQLFLPLRVEGVEVSVKEASLIDLLLNDRPRRRNFCLPRLFQQFRYDARIYGGEATRLYREQFDFARWARGRKVYLSSFVYFHPQPQEQMFRIFHPLPDLQRQIEERCSDFTPCTIGIHIRRTDNAVSIRQSPTHLFINKVEEETAQRPDANFYLATDSEEEKALLTHRFGRRIMTLKRKADRGSLSGMQDALVELYALSRTCRILGSMHSSYSETAAQIGGIPCELLTVEEAQPTDSPEHSTEKQHPAQEERKEGRT
ncbi:MAG: oligosaccharide flippase family protein [Bacteroides sp.]|nr:oligosaccharide flippase family protein [Bacteroides sp.]